MASPRLPTERLADCCWLPRFVDKARALLAGELPFLYRTAFGSVVGVDGHFLRHFQIARTDFVRSVRTAADDEAVATWFLGQPHVNRDTIEAWNGLAPTLGAVGHPGRGVFLAVRWFLYPKDFRNPSKCMFAAIEQDEA
jgi:Domain of unknown function (DUF5069)